MGDMLIKKDDPSIRIPSRDEVIKPTLPPSPPKFTGQKWSIPTIPTAVSGLHPNISQQGVSNLWETYHTQPQYMTPEYKSFRESQGLTDHPGTAWTEPWDILRHGTQSMNMSMPQMEEILMALGFASPEEVISPEWAEKSMGYLKEFPGTQGPKESWGDIWAEVMAGQHGASRTYPTDVIDLWKKYYGIDIDGGDDEDEDEDGGGDGGGGDGGGGDGGGGDGGDTFIPKPPPEVPYETEWDMLEKFGYTGPMGINEYEKAALEFISELYGTQAPLKTLIPAMDFHSDVLAGEYKPDISGYTEPAKNLYGDFIAGEYTPDLGGKREPAEALYRQILGGDFSPESEAFRQSVYEATKAGALQNLSEMQDMTAEDFSHRGGYFGGKHALAQSLLGEKVGTGLNEILANLNLSGFESDLERRMGAATGMRGIAGESLADILADVGIKMEGATGMSNLANIGLAENALDVGSRQTSAAGLESLGKTQTGITGSILDSLFAGGGMLTQREMVNRAEEQSAMERAYNDWLRARQETFMPFNWAQQLMGYQPYQPIAQQNQPSPWGALLGSIGSMAGNLAVPGLGNLLKIPAYM